MKIKVKEAEKKCETILGVLDQRECGKPAKYIVNYQGSKDKFLVCEDCISGYRFVIGKEFGNTHSNFIIKNLK